MKEGGIVLVHQDIFPNPTSELSDLVIPAVGWGEDTFCRYNAQRRLKLYDRFQDLQLHEVDRAKLDNESDKDPMRHLDDGRLRVDLLKHSPKPDWMIIRDISRALGREMDAQVGDTMSYFEVKMQEAFPLLYFGMSRGIDPAKGTLHQVLGKKIDGQEQDGLALTQFQLATAHA